MCTGMWREWFETITWKFGHELSLHLCLHFSAERTLALDNFGNFVSFNYPVLPSEFDSGCNVVIPGWPA